MPRKKAEEPSVDSVPVYESELGFSAVEDERFIDGVPVVLPPDAIKAEYVTVVKSSLMDSKKLFFFALLFSFLGASAGIAGGIALAKPVLQHIEGLPGPQGPQGEPGPQGKTVTVQVNGADSNIQALTCN